MKITYKNDAADPVHPIMHGETPLAKEFNKRQAALWSNGKFDKFDFEQVATILLEIFGDEYNKLNTKAKKPRIKK